MIHRGEIIKEAIDKSGVSVSEVARRLGKSRRFMYDIFLTPNVSLDYIIKIAKIISIDFSDQIPELKSTSKSKSTIETDWKEKYFLLLEKHNELLEKKIQEYFIAEKKQVRRNSK